MTYQYRYTTREIVGRRLRNRLELQDPYAPGASSASTLGGQEVDELLLEDFSSEVENYLDLILGQIYIIPLQQQHPLLSGIASDLIAAYSMGIHFQGNYNVQEGGDSGYGAVLLRRARQNLMLVTAGHQVYIPEIQPAQQVPGTSITPQPIVLQGEVLQTNSSDTITKNVTVIGTKKTNASNIGVSWGAGLDLKRRCCGGEQLL